MNFAHGFERGTQHKSTATAGLNPFILGALISMIILGVAYFSLKAKNLHLAHQLKNTEKELANLRMSPIKDQI